MSSPYHRPLTREESSRTALQQRSDQHPSFGESHWNERATAATQRINMHLWRCYTCCSAMSRDCKMQLDVLNLLDVFLSLELCLKQFCDPSSVQHVVTLCCAAPAELRALMSMKMLTAALCLAELWRIFLGGQTGQLGQPQLGQPGNPNQAQPTLPDFGQPLKSNHKSLSSPNPSTLLFRGGSLLPNPFASLSSVPLRGKLPDLASLQNKPSRRRTVLPDLTEVRPCSYCVVS